MKKILLTKKQFALVDDSDFNWLSQWKWYCSTIGYAVRTKWLSKEKKYIKIRMHRLIMDNPDGFEVDHKDMNTLNNQRNNLRIVTHGENGHNSGLRKNNTSGYKGVSWFKRKNKWRARIMINGKEKLLGYFLTKEAAAKTYKIYDSICTT